MGIYGRNSTSVDARLNASLLVGPFAFTRSRFDNISDSVTGFGDLIPQFSLRWNAGVRNFMTCVTGDIPVGQSAAQDGFSPFTPESYSFL